MWKLIIVSFKVNIQEKIVTDKSSLDLQHCLCDDHFQCKRRLGFIKSLNLFSQLKMYDGNIISVPIIVLQ